MSGRGRDKNIKSSSGLIKSGWEERNDTCKTFATLIILQNGFALPS